MAALFPVRTLVLFLSAEKYDLCLASALDEAGCSFIAPGLHKAGKPASPCSQRQPGTQGEESSSPKPPYFKYFSSIVMAQSKECCMVEFTGP